MTTQRFELVITGEAEVTYPDPPDNEDTEETS